MAEQQTFDSSSWSLKNLCQPIPPPLFQLLVAPNNSFTDGCYFCVLTPNSTISLHSCECPVFAHRNPSQSTDAQTGNVGIMWGKALDWWHVTSSVLSVTWPPYVPPPCSLYLTTIHCPTSTSLPIWLAETASTAESEATYHTCRHGEGEILAFPKPVVILYQSLPVSSVWVDCLSQTKLGRNYNMVCLEQAQMLKWLTLINSMICSTYTHTHKKCSVSDLMAGLVLSSDSDDDQRKPTSFT